jgi:hypothetical protein
MNKNMTTTNLLITIIVIILVIYDLIIFVFHGESSTISRAMQFIGFENPMITFGCGFLCGHFFGYMPYSRKKS